MKDDIVEIEKVQLTGNPDHLLEAVKTITKDVQRLVDRTRAIINGDFSKEELVEPVTLDQGDTDALFDYTSLFANYLSDSRQLGFDRCPPPNQRFNINGSPVALNKTFSNGQSQPNPTLTILG